MSEYAIVLSFWLFASDNSDAIVGLVLILLLVILCLGVYFLPSIIANARHHHNRVPIILVNLFF